MKTNLGYILLTSTFAILLTGCLTDEERCGPDMELIDSVCIPVGSDDTDAQTGFGAPCTVHADCVDPTIACMPSFSGGAGYCTFANCLPEGTEDGASDDTHPTCPEGSVCFDFTGKIPDAGPVCIKESDYEAANNMFP